MALPCPVRLALTYRVRVRVHAGLPAETRTNKSVFNTPPTRSSSLGLTSAGRYSLAMDTGESVRRRALLREISEVENRSMWSAQGQFEQAKGWQSLNLWLGSLAAGCAAVSGALVLSSAGLDIFGGVLALVAAAGGAVLTVVNASQRATKATAAANAYLEIQNAARRARMVDAPWMDVEEGRAILQGLTERMDEQNKSAEPISPRAHRKADRNIASGGQTAPFEELTDNA
jgi:hypothetical protein